MHHDNVHALFQHLGTLGPSQGFWGTWGIYFREQRSKYEGNKGDFLEQQPEQGNKAIYFMGTRLGAPQFCKSCI